MSHDHPHAEGHDDVADLFTQQTWDARYAGVDRVWSGRPNRRLVEQVTDLPPGRALDIGAGEGADAVWLAQQGWDVTALDVSSVALERTARHAADADVAGRVTTLHHDLMTGDALPTGFDLVSAQYLHPPIERFAEIIAILGAAVRDGGLLLVVGHHPDDLATGLHSGHGHPELLFPPERVVDALDPARWKVTVAQAQTREVPKDDGPVTVTDSVVLATRR